MEDTRTIICAPLKDLETPPVGYIAECDTCGAKVAKSLASGEGTLICVDCYLEVREPTDEIQVPETVKAEVRNYFQRKAH